MERDDLIACVLRAHGVLDRESDLSPSNPRINEALSALVRGVMEGCPPGDARLVLADPGVSKIRGALLQRLASAEGAMERHWAKAFCSRASLTAADLCDFTYWDCYHHLVGAELRTLAPRLQLDTGESIAFVGAGPLPLSAIIMHVRTGMPVTCIDADPEACGLARELCRKADLAGVEAQCASGAHHDYTCNPVIVVASLVADKAQVVRRILATRPQPLVALRSAEGLCTLLYDPVDEAELKALGCDYLGRTGRSARAINTTLLYEAAPPLRVTSDSRARDGRRVGATLGLPLLRLGRSRAQQGARRGAGSMPLDVSAAGGPGPLLRLSRAAGEAAAQPGRPRTGRRRRRRGMSYAPQRGRHRFNRRPG